MKLKDLQTGKKTVTADDLKPGMYFRHIADRGLRQLVKINGSGVDVYHVIDCADGSQGNHGSLRSLADAFNDGVTYELLDEQPVLILPVPVKAEPAPRAANFDPYGVFAAAYANQSVQFVSDPEPIVTEIQLADGTTIVITTPGK